MNFVENIDENYCDIKQTENELHLRLGRFPDVYRLCQIY